MESCRFYQDLYINLQCGVNGSVVKGALRAMNNKDFHKMSIVHVKMKLKHQVEFTKINTRIRTTLIIS
jgi:hypothetical protein